MFGFKLGDPERWVHPNEYERQALESCTCAIVPGLINLSSVEGTCPTCRAYFDGLLESCTCGVEGACPTCRAYFDGLL